MSYESEEERLRDLYPSEYMEGWRDSEPQHNPSWPASRNHYPKGSDQSKAYNAGWNDRVVSDRAAAALAW